MKSLTPYGALVLIAAVNSAWLALLLLPTEAIARPNGQCCAPSDKCEGCVDTEGTVENDDGVPVEVYILVDADNPLSNQCVFVGGSTNECHTESLSCYKADNVSIYYVGCILTIENNVNLNFFTELCDDNKGTVCV